MCHYVILWQRVIIKSNRYHPQATRSWNSWWRYANILCATKKRNAKQDVLPDILDFANWVQEKNSQYGRRSLKKTIVFLENVVRFINHGDKAIMVAGSILVILDHCVKCQSSLNNGKLIKNMRGTKLSMKENHIWRSLFSGNLLFFANFDNFRGNMFPIWEANHQIVKLSRRHLSLPAALVKFRHRLTNYAECSSLHQEFIYVWLMQEVASKFTFWFLRIYRPIFRNVWKERSWHLVPLSVHRRQKC